MFKNTRSMISLMLILALCMTSVVFMTACGSKEAPAEAPVEEPAEEPAAEPEPEPAAEPAEEPAADQGEQDVIGEDKALEVALKDAGVKESDVTYKQVHLDYDDDTGRQEYEIEFHVGTTEYEYNVDALTGEITEKDLDNDND